MGLIPAEPPCRGINFQQAMDRLRIHAGGLDQPLRCPSRGGAQQALHILCPQDHQDGIDERRLADAGAARDHDHAVGENRLQRLALAGRKRLARSLLAPRNRFLEVNRRIGRLLLRQTPDPCRDPPLLLFSDAAGRPADPRSSSVEHAGR
jgi:hypothetical protein